MKGWLLSTAEKPSYETKKIVKEFKKAGIECFIVDPRIIDIYVTREDRKSIQVGNEYTILPNFVIPRMGSKISSYSTAVLRHLEKLGVLLINSSEAISNAKDKLYTMQILAQENIPTPRTMLTKYPINLDFIKKRIGFPVVIKTLSGMHGKGVYLAEKPSNLEQLVDVVMEVDNKTNLLIQEFIGYKAGTDIRIFLVGGKIVGAFMRQSKDGDFRANITRGGLPKPIELDSDAEFLAIQCANILNLDIAGVDLLIDKEGYRICEVNSAPGFEGLEKASKSNIALEIVQYVQQKLSLAI